MNTVVIRLFDRFQVISNGRELPLAPSVKEMLSLLIVAGGKRVTPKTVWKVLYDYKKIGYNGTLYTRRVNDLKIELEFFQLSDLIHKGTSATRFCRINRDVIVCDYYEMLDGKMPLEEKKSFLPEYEWANSFYQKDWYDLYQYWDSLEY